MFLTLIPLCVFQPGGQMNWTPEIDKLILEMLANRTPPSCFRSNLEATARTILPHQKIVMEMPCTRYVRGLGITFETSS